MYKNEHPPAPKGQRDVALQLLGVTAEYITGNAVLHGIDLSIERAQLVGIIGANGAGKSTLVRVLSGKVSGGGTIRLGGKTIDRLPTPRRIHAGLGVVPDGPGVCPDLTVAENLRLGAVATPGRGDVPQRLTETYQVFPKLRERSGQLAGTLSGGERRMLAIGRALMGAPQVLVLDEPSVGLSPVAVKTLFQTLAAYARDGGTVLVTEQNVRELARHADTVHVLRLGKFVQRLGDPRVLLTEKGMRHAFEIGYVGV